MKKKLSNQITLRLSNEMYEDLLKSAGSPEDIPELIRNRLVGAESTSSALKLLEKQQEAQIQILTDLALDLVPIQVRMRKIVQGFEDPQKREAELAEVRNHLENKIKKIQSYKERI